MALQEDNTLNAEIFDYLIIPSTEFGEEVRFGIQSHSTHPRFRKIFFRTRRPIEDYRDFCEFIASRYPNILLPPLPFEEALPHENENELKRKKFQLQDFFQELLQIPDVFNDPSLPFFIQSHMTMEEIREKIAEQEAEADKNANEEQVEESNDDQQAGADNDNDQHVAADNEQQVEANNRDDQQVAAGNINDQQVAAGNNQQVLENGDGGQPSDGENGARGNTSESETDEPIFRMEDI